MLILVIPRQEKLEVTVWVRLYGSESRSGAAEVVLVGREDNPALYVAGSRVEGGMLRQRRACDEVVNGATDRR